MILIHVTGPHSCAPNDTEYTTIYQNKKNIYQTLIHKKKKSGFQKIPSLAGDVFHGGRRAAEQSAGISNEKSHF